MRSKRCFKAFLVNDALVGASDELFARAEKDPVTGAATSWGEDAFYMKFNVCGFHYQ